MSQKLNYGGQAVIEGVMMRGSKGMAVAVRAPDQSIVVHEEPLKSSLYAGRLSRIPFVRGLSLLWDALGLGTRALMYSAKIAVEDEAEDSEIDRSQGGEKVEFGSSVAWTTMAFSLVFFVGLFFLTPRLAADGILLVLGDTAGLVNLGLLGNIIEGIFRLTLMIGYIWIIGRLPDIQRVFAYHGAEHKTINAYEAGAELVPNIVAKFPLEHPRCGTGFLLVVMVISIIIYSILGDLPLLIRYGSRIVFVPIIAAIAYEYIRFMARHLDKPLVRALISPQLALQKLTTREPSTDMLEVAIVALTKVLTAENSTAVENKPTFVAP